MRAVFATTGALVYPSHAHVPQYRPRISELQEYLDRLCLGIPALLRPMRQERRTLFRRGKRGNAAVIGPIEHEEHVAARIRREVGVGRMQRVAIEQQQPASFPFGASMPYLSTKCVNASGLGTPTSCAFNERLWLSSGVSPWQGTNSICEPGINISGPLNSWLSVKISEALTACMLGIPSSACQVSKSECQLKPLPAKPGL